VTACVPCKTNLNIGSEGSWFRAMVASSVSFAGAMRLYRMRQLPEAEAICRKILTTEPQNAEVLHLIGMIASTAQHYDVAVAFIRKAIALDDGRASFHAGLGRAYRFLWRLDEAVQSCRRSLAIDPALADAHYELGATLYQQGRVVEAMECCRHAIELEPNHVNAHCKLGTAHMLLGEWAIGWAEYEWRLRGCELHQEPHGLAPRRWRGEPLAGARILIHAETGLGETLQYVRFVPLVAARGGRVVLEVQPELHRLLSGYLATDAVVPRGASIPDCIWHCPLVSLPHVLGTELATVPSKIPYVTVPPGASQVWSTRLGDIGLRIGLVWAGEPTRKWDRVRSLRQLSLLAPLGEIDGLTLFSLQKGAAAEEASDLPAGLKLVDLSPHLHDFADTAAAIAGLDLVITADTSVVHLAGALGKPIWIMLAHVADWKWLIGREDSPWYPTARLFRQPALGAWDAVIEHITGELRRLVEGDRSVLHPIAAETDDIYLSH
jgi:Tetratricopeptide repeat/Glycosyltransferase family 9 (heptosyltransferase)